MSLHSMELPDHTVHGEELEELWVEMWSFSDEVKDEDGVVVQEIHDDQVGDFRRIKLPIEFAPKPELLEAAALAGHLAGMGTLEIEAA